MDIESALHKKCNQKPMAVTQRLISSMMRRHVGVLGVCVWGGGLRRSYHILSNDVPFDARPLCSLTRCTA